MQFRMLGAALTAATLLAGTAFAQDTITRERTVTEPGAGVTVGVPGVGVRVGEPDRTTTTTTTTGVRDRDCDSKTVHRDDGVSSTTVRKERCD